MISRRVDKKRAEAFGDRMLEILNAGAVGVMISIGHRTGLFDTLGELPPSTSEEIARAARLNERYVREWLGLCSPGGSSNAIPRANGSGCRRSTPHG